MILTEDKIADVTDTFFDRDGEIVAITEVANRKTDYGNFYIYYGKYCTGPRDNDQTYPFLYAEVSAGLE